MRGSDERSGSLFSSVDPESRVPAGHPSRVIRRISDEVLAGMSGAFDAACAPLGRPCIPPERLMRALLPQAFHTIRSERRLVERLDFDLLVRRFVGLGVDDPVWDASSFAKNRERFPAMEAATRFPAGVVAHPDVRRQMSRDHFSVDGTLIEAWASMKSFRPKDEDREDEGGGEAGGSGRDAGRDFRGETRSNESHASTTDPVDRFPDERAAEPAPLHRHGADGEPRRAGDGRTSDAGLGRPGMLLGDRSGGRTRPARRRARRRQGLDAADVVAELRERRITPHVARNPYDTGKARRRSNIDGRTTRRPGCATSQRIRERLEEMFGRLKTVAGRRKSRFRGLDRTGQGFHLALAACNLTRMPKLLA